MQRIFFQMHLSPSDLELYYKGVVKQLIVRSSDGRRIAFPFSKIQPFVTMAGISGQFELRYDDATHAFVDLQRVR